MTDASRLDEHVHCWHAVRTTSARLYGTTREERCCDCGAEQTRHDPPGQVSMWCQIRDAHGPHFPTQSVTVTM